MEDREMEQKIQELMELCIAGDLNFHVLEGVIRAAVSLGQSHMKQKMIQAISTTPTTYKTAEEWKGYAISYLISLSENEL